MCGVCGPWCWLPLLAAGVVSVVSLFCSVDAEHVPAPEQGLYQPPCPFHRKTWCWTDMCLTVASSWSICFVFPFFVCMPFATRSPIITLLQINTIDMSNMYVSTLLLSWVAAVIDSYRCILNYVVFEKYTYINILCGVFDIFMETDLSWWFCISLHYPGNLDPSWKHLYGKRGKIHQYCSTLCKECTLAVASIQQSLGHSNGWWGKHLAGQMTQASTHVRWTTNTATEPISLQNCDFSLIIFTYQKMVSWKRTHFFLKIGHWTIFHVSISLMLIFNSALFKRKIIWNQFSFQQYQIYNKPNHID